MRKGLSFGVVKDSRILGIKSEWINREVVYGEMC